MNWSFELFKKINSYDVNFQIVCRKSFKNVIKNCFKHNIMKNDIFKSNQILNC